MSVLKIIDKVHLLLHSKQKVTQSDVISTRLNKPRRVRWHVCATAHLPGKPGLELTHRESQIAISFQKFTMKIVIL